MKAAFGLVRKGERALSIKKIALWTLVAVALSTAPQARADICQADVCVRFAPTNSAVILNHNFSIDVLADINQPVVGWGLDVTLGTPGVISQTANPDIGPAWIPVNAPDGDHLAGIAFPNGVSGTNILLATLHFHADSDGETDLLLGITPGDQTEGFALDPNGFGTLLFENGHVSVPEPASLMLCLVGAALGRRRRRA